MIGFLATCALIIIVGIPTIEWFTASLRPKEIQTGLRGKAH
jgi:hypothetical protein